MKIFNSALKYGIGAFAVSCCISLSAHAQESDGHNSNSLRPIHESDQLYATRVWRRVDLREKQNKPFFSENRQITKVIIEAVMNGTLYPYTNDSLNTRMSKEQFIENLTIPTDEVGPTEDEIAMGFGQETQDAGWGDAWGDTDSNSGEGAEGTQTGVNNTTATAANEGPLLFSPRDVTVLELMEDVIFDKHRGRQYYDIQAVTMILPPENFPETGLLRQVASFKYVDLVKVFEENPETAVWVNPQNNAKHLNLRHAFDLRLFTSRIVKYSNADDEYIIDMVDGERRQALLKSLDYEYQMLEREHQLWEY